MTVVDTTAPAQTAALAFEFDLPHPPEKVWRAPTDPELLAEWLLPVIDFETQPGAARYGWKMMGGKLVDLLGRIA